MPTTPMITDSQYVVLADMVEKRVAPVELSESKIAEALAARGITQRDASGLIDAYWNQPHKPRGGGLVRTPVEELTSAFGSEPVKHAASKQSRDEAQDSLLEDDREPVGAAS